MKLIREEETKTYVVLCLEYILELRNNLKNNSSIPNLHFPQNDAPYSKVKKKSS